MEETQISVIIPVYNVRKFLPQCLDSLLKQTYPHWEAILVDDASTDGSLAICQEYASKDARFRTVRQPQNAGVEKARWRGAQEMQGRYCTFVDSDDWLEKDFLKQGYAMMAEYGCSYVEMNMQRVMDRHQWRRKVSKQPLNGLVKQPELFRQYYVSFFGCNILNVNLCGKLYDGKTIKEHMPEPAGLSMGEDEYANLMMFPHLNGIYISDYIGYNYRFGGITSRYNPHLLPDIKKLYHIRRGCIEQYEFQQGRRPLDIEAKNVLRSELLQRCIYRPHDGQGWLSSELQDPMWDDVVSTLGGEASLDAFSALLANRDAGSLYQWAHGYIRRTFFKRWAKHVASAVLMRL